MSAFGRGSEVRWGFCERAASMALDDEGGVMRCMSCIASELDLGAFSK